jgi:hypothetical protein
MEQMPGFLEHDEDLKGTIGWKHSHAQSLRKKVSRYYAWTFFWRSDA